MIEFHKGHYQVTRKAHLAHLARVMPLLALVYASQIVLMPILMSSDFVSTSLIVAGLCLIGFVAFFYFFDHYQKTVITPDKIILEFHPFFEQKAINLDEIIKTEILDPGASFSTIILRLKNGSKLSLHLVDQPDEVHTVIQNYLSSNSEHLKVAS